MANKRMFSLDIVGSDVFLEMPVSARELYFQFGMYADNEGFVGSPKKIMRLVNATDDDFKILLTRRYVLSFDSGVIVIKHWLKHNSIRLDRLQGTTYQKEKSLLGLNEWGVYTEIENSVANLKENSSFQEDSRRTPGGLPPNISKYKLIKDNIIKGGKIKISNNGVIALNDGTKAKNYFGTWVDAEDNQVKINVPYYPELENYELS